MEMKNILITGGSGFIGKNLKEFLLDKYNLFYPTHRELDLLDTEKVYDFVTEKKIDIIIHAAVHVPMFNGKDNEYDNDMKMFMNLYSLNDKVEKIIYFGSGAEYDKRYDISMVTEDLIGKNMPVSDYGRAKYDMNTIARNSDNVYNLRLFGIYGKYELWEIKFLSNLICKALYDLPLTIRMDCYFDFLYIDDLSRIVEWFIENKPLYHDYNVCYGTQYKLTEFAEMILKTVKKELPIILLSGEKNKDYSASNRRLLKEIGNVQIAPIKKSLRDLNEYYKNNLDLIDYNILRNSR